MMKESNRICSARKLLCRLRGGLHPARSASVLCTALTQIYWRVTETTAFPPPPSVSIVHLSQHGWCMCVAFTAKVLYLVFAVRDANVRLQHLKSMLHCIISKGMASPSEL